MDEHAATVSSQDQQGRDSGRPCGPAGAPAGAPPPPPPPRGGVPTFRPPLMPAHRPPFAGGGGHFLHPSNSALPPPGYTSMPYQGMHPAFRPAPPPYLARPAPGAAGSPVGEDAWRSGASWVGCRDAAGNIYYHNSHTGVTTWQRPPHMLSTGAQPPAAPRPVSSERIAGTDWLEVRTSDGTAFWHNNVTGQGTWQAPPEVAAAQRMSSLDPAKLAMLERARAAGARVAPDYITPDAGVAAGQQATVGDAGEDEDVTFTEDDAGGAAAAAEAPLIAAGGPVNEPGSQAAALQPPLPPAQTTPAPPAQPHPDDVIAAFKLLLREKGVHGFSHWERELPKLQADPRFKALASGRRRQVFEEYCSEAGKAKMAAAKGASGSARPAAAGASAGKARGDAFKALLRERGVGPKASWPDTLDRLGSDPRCAALPAAHAKVLFREYVAALQRAEQGRMAAERRGDAERRAGEERQRQAGQAAALANYRTLLTEVVREPAVGAWHEYRSLLERDPQARAVHPLLPAGAAEGAFNAHVSGLLEAATSAMRSLLEERLQPMVPTSEDEAALGGLPPALSTWEAAEVMLRGDARCTRLPAGLREGVWRQFVEDAMWSRDHPGQKRQRGMQHDIAGMAHAQDERSDDDAAKRARLG